MKVSVIIAAYNIEKYLESIVNQTLGEIKIIVINDGSTDETLEIIKRLAIKEDRIVIGILEKNLYNYYQREDSMTEKVRSKISEVDKALDFIEEQLKKKNLYELYRKEFEYTTFKHLFYCRILIADKIESIHKTICKQFKDRKIDIYNNAYIAAYINENAVSFRVRARLYNRNYYLGRIYDLGRKITKRH